MTILTAIIISLIVQVDGNTVTWEVSGNVDLIEFVRMYENLDTHEKVVDSFGTIDESMPKNLNGYLYKETFKKGRYRIKLYYLNGEPLSNEVNFIIK
jgi:hypothetical protein